MSAPLPDPSAAPSIRGIARRLGLSSGTVSMALRDDPLVAKSTRQNVRQLADELGYRPDPQLSRLMHQVRKRRGPVFQSTIAAFTNMTEAEERPYLTALLNGARKQASALGFTLELFRRQMNPSRDARLQRLLDNRGIDGLLILPSLRIPELGDWLDWSRFSIVTTTWRVPTPLFHRAVPHQFGNMLLLCEELGRRGYRRIGLVAHIEHDRGVSYGFSAGLARHQDFGRAGRLRPLLFSSEKPSGLRAWFKREKPDIIVATDPLDCHIIADELGLGLPGPVGFAVTSGATVQIAGIDEQPAEVGASAIDLLAARIQRGETGVPKVHTVTMIVGNWVEGKSIRPARKAT